TSVSSVVSTFFYKGKEGEPIWQSRKGPWEQTWSVIKANPWFGTGFGTSVIEEDLTQREFARFVGSRAVREHGNSYLAIAEWQGMLGVVPFFLLVALVLRNVSKAFRLIRAIGDPSSLVIPAAAVVLAGIVHAIFEDWLFAIGN